MPSHYPLQNTVQYHTVDHLGLNELHWLEFEWMVDSKLLARYDLRVDITYSRSEVKMAKSLPDTLNYVQRKRP